MIKIIICMFISISFAVNGYSQNVDLKFREILYCTACSFKSISKNKYYNISSLEVKSDRLGSLISFKINFNSKKTKLTKFEHNWWFSHLKKYNYNFLKEFYSSEELKNKSELNGRLKFIKALAKEYKCAPSSSACSGGHHPAPLGEVWGAAIAAKPNRLG